MIYVLSACDRDHIAIGSIAGNCGATKTIPARLVLYFCSESCGSYGEWLALGRQPGGQSTLALQKTLTGRLTATIEL